MKIRLYGDDGGGLKVVSVTLPDQIEGLQSPVPSVVIRGDRVYLKMDQAGLSTDGYWRYVEVDAVQIEE